MRISCQRPETLVFYPVTITEFSQLFVVSWVTVKPVLQKWGLYLHLIIKSLKVLWIIAVADAKVMNFSLFDKFFKNFPNFHCFLKGPHWTMQNEWIYVSSFQII